VGMVEGGGKIADLVTAELIECQPEPEPVVTEALPAAPDASPVQAAQDATIEQTGADPPPVVTWKLYYGDGSTFSNLDGPPSAAPPCNLQALAQQSDIAIGRKTVSHYDFYWWDDGEWFGGDLYGLFDYLQRQSPSIVKFGRALPRLQFEAILARAVQDPDLLPKTAWDAHEAPRP
jgi:hypothetical protein